jgi:hypothetical protein
MQFVRRVLLAVLALSAALIVFAVPAGSLASSTATTGQATDIAQSTAILNGIVDTTYPDNAYNFQYGTTTAYGSVSGVEPVGPGVTAVSKEITGLKPGTTYHFRLVVEQDYPSTDVSEGADATFTTPTTGPYYGIKPTTKPQVGTASVTTKTVTVKGKRASIPMKCSGAKKGLYCIGAVALTAKGKHGKSVSCGSGKFIATTPHSHTVVVTLSKSCLTLLAKAKHHRLAGTVTARFLGPQAKLTKSVTIARPAPKKPKKKK